jgi:hypothetical protein
MPLKVNQKGGLGVGFKDSYIDIDRMFIEVSSIDRVFCRAESHRPHVLSSGARRASSSPTIFNLQTQAREPPPFTFSQESEARRMTTLEPSFFFDRIDVRWPFGAKALAREPSG